MNHGLDNYIASLPHKFIAIAFNSRILIKANQTLLLIFSTTNNYNLQNKRLIDPLFGLHHN